MKPQTCFKGILFPALLFGAFVIAGSPAFAHVPYWEHRDFSIDRPFQVRAEVDQSIAVYAWLTTDGINPYTDVDVVAFEVDETPVRVYLEVLVPVCPGYEDFAPWFALAGPGLPEPLDPLPFDLPPGSGVLVFPNTVPGEHRDTFYEPFGGKSYYQGPVFDEFMDLPGRYHVYFWDPYELGGDYVAVLGWKEIWRPRDILRALFYTPLIRQDEELHIDCGE